MVHEVPRACHDHGHSGSDALRDLCLEAGWIPNTKVSWTEECNPAAGCGVVAVQVSFDLLFYSFYSALPRGYPVFDTFKDYTEVAIMLSGQMRSSA